MVDARVSIQPAAAPKMVAEMTLTTERSRDGGHSLRFRSPTKLDGPGPVNGRGWGSSGVIRHFDGEDWRNFNRLSLWIYPDCPGTYKASLGMHIHNDGVEKLPAAFGQEGDNSILLRNREWNHVVWEIGNVARDKITELEFTYGMSGNEPEAADTVSTISIAWNWSASILITSKGGRCGRDVSRTAKRAISPAPPRAPSPTV